MAFFAKGRYRARMAASDDDVIRAQALRHRAFRGGAGRDSDAFDARCRHVLVEEAATGALVCCYRLLPLPSGAAVATCYSAQFYDLAALAALPGPLVELGRFCIDPARSDPDILRAAWAALTRHVDSEGVEMLIGCASFPGTAPAPYADSFALLAQRHLAPPRWRPGVGAGEVYHFARELQGHPPDPRRGMRMMPPLLRSYLGLGGQVSDHAVIDRDLGTLHVFTGLDIGAIPPARQKLFRAMAG